MSTFTVCLDFVLLLERIGRSRKGLKREGMEGNIVTYMLVWKINNGTELKYINCVWKLHYKGTK